MNVKEIRASLAAAKGVDAIHSLHVWALTSGVPVLSAHVRVSEQAWVDGSGPRILDELTHTAQHQWGIDHCTF
ncbi:cation transporter, partial [Pauljensenia sp. UMB3104]|nr:cation transporter [Pauljensenia sp. UMB3104]